MLEQVNTKSWNSPIDKTPLVKQVCFLEIEVKQSSPFSFIGELLIAMPGLPKKEMGEGQWFNWGNTMKVFEQAELFLYLLNSQAKLLQE